MLKKISLILLGLSLIILLGLYFLLNTTFFVEKILPGVLKNQLRDFAVETVKCQSQHFQFPDQIQWRDLEIVLRKDDERQTYRINEMGAKRLFSFFNAEGIDLHILKGSAQSPVFDMRGIDFNGKVYFREIHFQEVKGVFHVDEIKINSYEISQITGDLVGDVQKMEMKHLIGSAYDGQIQGQIFLDFAKGVTYSIDAVVVDLESQSLRRANDTLFSSFQGSFAGDLKIRGDIENVKGLSANFSMASGGKIKASLLGFILQHIPQSQQRKDLEKLIKTNGDVLLEKAEISMQSLKEDQLVNRINLESRKFNLDIHLEVEVNVEGGLGRWFKYFQAFSN